VLGVEPAHEEDPGCDEAEHTAHVIAVVRRELEPLVALSNLFRKVYKAMGVESYPPT